VAAGGAALELREVWHPCARAPPGGCIVANDLLLGSAAAPARSLLLTGPNMGGKSTCVTLWSHCRVCEVYLRVMLEVMFSPVRSLLLIGPNIGNKVRVLLIAAIFECHIPKSYL